MTNDTFQAGKELGRKHLAHIQAKGRKWLQRNIPVFIRENLLVPFYLTESEGTEVLFVIQSPLTADEKVHFIEYARRSLPDEGSPQISAGL